MKAQSYDITYDNELVDEEIGVTPELKELFPEYHELATKGKQKGIKILNRAIKKYPNVPTLKNFLSVLYSTMGNSSQASKVTKWISDTHPDYLFGKVNMAFQYYHDQEYEKMVEILGEEMELSALYPDTKVFHISEVTSYIKSTIAYYTTKDNLEEAESRCAHLEEIAPDSKDTNFAMQLLGMARVRLASKGWKEAEENRINVIVQEQAETTKVIPPTFNHKQIELLYEHGLYIEKALIEEILALPRESLIKDLELVLRDSIERFTFFVDMFEEIGWDEEKTSFVLHAIFLLGELKAEESLKCIFDVFGQSESYYETYFGDFFTDLVWEPLYKIASNRLQDCLPFMYLPGICTNPKSLFFNIAEVAMRKYPKRRGEIIDWFRQVITFFLNCNIKDNIIDSQLMGYLVWTIMDCGVKELLPDIKKLYDMELVDLQICGAYEDVELTFGERKEVRGHKELLPMLERYQKVTSTWGGYKKDQEEEEDDDAVDLPLVATSTKTGRNDPCPCGSGKKYKKCCLNT